MEEWRKIDGSKGQYEVSNKGRVRNAWTGRILKTNGRRPKVRLAGHVQKTFDVSRLVANAFLGEGRLFHKDGDQSNNRVENLGLR